MADCCVCGAEVARPAAIINEFVLRGRRASESTRLVLHYPLAEPLHVCCGCTASVKFSAQIWVPPEEVAADAIAD
jgi:hypothetical protein